MNFALAVDLIQREDRRLVVFKEAGTARQCLRHLAGR
jgi:hypothetical protein